MLYPSEGFLDAALLRRLAGDKLFAKGEATLAEGRVRLFQTAADRAAGRVEGTRAYRVKLWKSRGELQHSCNCPVGQEQKFCQHCVAVGLAWLEGADNVGDPAETAAEPPKPGAGRSRDAGRAREKLADHLRTVGRDRLIQLVLEATDFDDIMRRRLLMEAAGVARGEPSRQKPGGEAAPDLEAYAKLLREAIETSEYVDYDAMPDYAQGVQEAIAPLAGLLRDGHAASVVELAEFALIELDGVSDLLDGSDGSLNAVYDDLQRFHLDACRAARPDPAGLAARLLQYEIEGGLGVFNNAAKTYAEVLGPAGVQAWRAQLVEAWSRLPAIGKADRNATIDHRRFQVQTLMERLAEAEGDPAALVAVKERELASAHDYLSLAELHAAQGHDDRAIARAEEGLRAFPSEHDAAGLRPFLAAAYERVGRHAEARDLLWNEFRRSGEIADYQRLREHVRRMAGESWPAWRERAFAHLRARPGRDGSAVVEILLAEHRYDSAWREAAARGCRVDLWLRLAAKREKKHPADALRVYQSRLEPTIAAGGPTAYREAVELLDKIRALLDRLGRGGDFAPYRAEIRAAHRQRRSFLKMLDAGGTA